MILFRYSNYTVAGSLGEIHRLVFLKLAKIQFSNKNAQHLAYLVFSN